MAELTDKQAYLVLNGLPDVGPVSLRRLLDSFDNQPQAILCASESRLMQVERIGPKVARIIAAWRNYVNLDKEEQALEKLQASFICRSEKPYPHLLKQLFDPPIGLYCLGQPEVLQMPAIAIVGTRRPTLYGRGIARRLAGDLTRAGYCVVSGMARGIDAEAHQGALEAGGKTVAVLGCGADIIYPPEHIDLYRAIQKSGVVLSEFRLGRRADKQTFPMRNRVIAGMTRATLVIESSAHGGSMITARFAGEQGRQVFAVPGRIDQASSEGCHALIRDGATLITNLEDILKELEGESQQELFCLNNMQGDPTEKALRKSEAQLAQLTPTERRVAECFLDGSQLTPQGVASQLDMPVHEVSALLVLLELRRFIGKRADGCYERMH